MLREGRSESAPNGSGGGTLKSKRGEKRSEEENEEDRIQRRPPRESQSSRIQFGSPRAKCGVTTFRT